MEKGQVFSLDFLISMIVVMAAIGLVIQTAEINTYNTKETRIQNELRNVAEITADLITASNETTCTDERSQPMMNCVKSTADFNPIKNFLTGSGYGYEIKGGAIGLSSGILGEKDYYETARKVFINKDFSGNAIDLKVRVWKE